MAKHEVTCKEKHALHERIISIGCTDLATGAKQRFSEDEAIQRIEAKTDVFIVKDDKGHEAIVEVEERNGRKFLITKRDDYITDNLLALPDCPAKRIVVPPYRAVASAGSHCVRSGWNATR